LRGKNASVSLRRNREIKVLLLLDCSTWPLEDNGQLRRRGPKRFWFPVEVQTTPFVSLEMAIGP